MTQQWQDPSAPAAAAAAPRWVEPTRATPLQVFDYSGRYGASLVAVLLGAYLVMNTNMSAFVNLATRGDALLALALGLQAAFGLAVLVAGLAIAPAPAAHRLLAVAAAVVVIVVAGVVIHLWLMGSVRVAGAWTAAVLSLPGATLFAASLGWLIVRRRPPLTALLLLLALVPGLLNHALRLAGVSGGAVNILLMPLVVAVVGVGIAWAARAIAAGTTRAPIYPAPPTSYATPPGP
ncbi:NADH dehydrogenase (quinone) [Beutenbergia cavernae DSM 12333]|uniref:NADH dehydrogenase (Quinone) n=1 Tax=Beutenbergia cavernae (strain ATCC BAA-8 / DSM 12333 / CCUG 43141 / JCM 11478 / NBRC 16432 / NCIMB 13614 / HKI 0122) TaxID=471853 RepID=C5BWY7_BEUC1|nr:hypothetical protein [Beutenbergia cavernae]ACQ80803.1 NADH dehydrogenase (quinone) [Beutenbergia cavernae DSM 12333]